MDNIFPILFFIAVGASSYYYIKKNWWRRPKGEFGEVNRNILKNHVSFYNALTSYEKRAFEYRVAEFIVNYKFSGKNTEVNNKDKILIAASAIIPIFSFPDWRYRRLKEIIIFPDNFNKSWQTQKSDCNIRGLVGYGYLDGKLLVSRTALYEGFVMHDDRRNTSIHEFIHLIDMEDGKVDGIPEKLLEHKYTIPWLFIMKKEVIRIHKGYSDIHPYATTNQGEFLAVLAEYFFERPEDFKNEHPRLFFVMEEMFKPTKSIYKRKKIEKN